MTNERAPVDRTVIPGSNQDAVELLLRLSTGHSLSDETRINRIRAATQAEWQRAVAEESRRRRRRRRSRLLLPLAASVLAATVVALAFMPGSPLDGWLRSSAPVARVIRGDHSGLVTKDHENKLLRAGEDLDTGDQRWALELLGEGLAGVSVRLDRETRVRLDQDGGIELQAGAVYIDNQGRAHQPLVVRTRHYEVIDIGTQFEVRQGPEHARVWVREGRVEVALRQVSPDQRAARVWQLAAGERLDLETATLEGAIAPASRFDPEWFWVIELAAAPRFDGHPMIDLVTWSARELGLDLRADQQTMDSLQNSLVFGDVTGLSPEVALDVGLSVSGIERTIDDGLLVLSSGVTEESPR